MNAKRMSIIALMLLAAAALLLPGCMNPVAQDSEVLDPTGLPIMRHDTKSVNNGFYYQIWDNNNGSPTLDYANQAAGRYTLTWNGTVSNWNFVCGKGWGSWNGSTSDSPASLSKIVNYSGTFIPNTSGSDYVNSYLDFYGWANNFDVEYYILESYGEYTPSTSSGYTSLGSYSSHGVTYNAFYKRQTGQPSPKGSGTYNFDQLYSIRTPRLAPGSVSGTIYLADHVAYWASRGYTLTSTQFQVMATEGYGAVGGNSDITVSEGNAGGGVGFASLAGKYVAAGSAYNMIGETRTPVVPDGNKVLDGLFIGMAFHNITGNSVELQLLMEPLNAATEALIRAEKDPGPEAYAGLSPSAAAGKKAFNWSYNASPLAVSAYRGTETITDGGMTINVGSFTFNGIQVNNLVMTYIHISDHPEPGVPYSEIKYDYTYTNDIGKSMAAKGLLFVSENPPPIPPSIPMILQKHAAPSAMVSGDSYSLASAWSGKHVTVTAAGNNAAVKAQPVNEAWTSQDWVAEFVSVPDRIVRLKNIWTGKYLHAQADAENAKAVCYDLHADWLSQQWQIEQTGHLKVRLKNLWTNRYLTVVDTGDYADIILKQLNTGWASQEWKVDWLKWKE